MIKVFKSEDQCEAFYAQMGKYFASLEIAKELERQLYNKDNAVWYVSYFCDIVEGFATVFDNGKYYFIDNLYVLPEFRECEVAKNIVKKIVSEHSDKPIRCIANNPYALIIFERTGFIEVGKNGKYKKLIKY